jgi:ribonuclease P protein component
MIERELRLRAAHEIRQARGRGKAFAAGPIVARIFPNGSEPPANRYAIIAGKKIGKAHERNRCKRLVREAVRRLDPSLASGYDVVFILRGGVGELTGYDVAETTLRQIFLRAKLLTGEGDAPTSTLRADEPASGDPS